MAIYGKEQWIKKYYNAQLYFDRKLIEDKKISLSEFQQRAAEFLVQFDGIQDVITSQQMLHGAYNQTVEFYRNGFYKGISGRLVHRISARLEGDRVIRYRTTNASTTMPFRLRSSFLVKTLLHKKFTEP